MAADFSDFAGLSSGIIIAGGVVGLMIGLSIVPRYAGITHTADHMLLYEDLTFLGVALGNLFCLFKPSLPLGNLFLILYGVFSGIFLGSWILALAEVADVFPVFCRRIHLTRGLPVIIMPLPLEIYRMLPFLLSQMAISLLIYMHKTQKSQKKSCLFSNIFIYPKNLSGKE